MTGRFSLIAAGLLLAASGAHAAGEDPDWPCVQRKVPQISVGQVWTGPPVDDIGDSWRQDAALAGLAREIASRRTSLEDARAKIADFAAAAADRSQRLTTLFVAVLSLVNEERSAIMAGIGRYARRQQALADKIEAQSAELGTLPDAGGTDEEIDRREELLEIQAWDARIFQERSRALTYVCELPVELDKRAFALGKAIAAEIGE